MISQGITQHMEPSKHTHHRDIGRISTGPQRHNYKNGCTHSCGIMTAKLILHVLLLRAVYRENHDALKQSHNIQEQAGSMNREAGGGNGTNVSRRKRKKVKETDYIGKNNDMQTKNVTSFHFQAGLEAERNG